ncbi:MAG: hypothetical protein E6J90_28075 [Deltaproteobacteria bacterium]|nr:MAG: hypothetical protein E6J91_20765 [Deltaproteobacteria bacterium]TMQ13642.1 MAG: hypothetical protein E6J90_28075 [Deltaproteobacteria bacterium]
MHDLESIIMESQGEGEFTAEGETLGEGEVERLAAELLSVSNEGELDHFLGDMFKKVASAAGSFIKSPIGQQLGGMLKGVAKKALPIAGAALGNFVAPGIGGAIGGKLASMAGSAFGLELEGLSGEDREFEVAKQFVRLAADAAKNAVGVNDASNPAAVAKAAITQAAQKFAPGLVNGHGTVEHRSQRSGRWFRRGNQIVLVGV